MPHYSRHFLVAKACSQRRCLAGVAHIVSGLKLPLNRTPAQLQLARIKLVKGHAHAVLLIFAQGRYRARDWCGMSNAHHQRPLVRASCSLGV